MAAMTRTEQALYFAACKLSIPEGYTITPSELGIMLFHFGDGDNPPAMIGIVYEEMVLDQLKSRYGFRRGRTAHTFDTLQEALNIGVSMHMLGACDDDITHPKKDFFGTFNTPSTRK